LKYEKLWKFTIKYYSLSILSIDAWLQISFFVSVPFPDRFNIAINKTI
jgi:hypothetical protein